MSRLQEQTRDLKSALTALYCTIQDELSKVDALLNSTLASSDPRVDEIVRHGIQLGGKRLRPALLLLTAKACGQVQPDHITLAGVVEMIHLATLIHDDVLDEASIRRHIESVNARWNNETSVLLGDFLFTHAFYLASTTGSTYACREIGKATNTVCEGELKQTANAGNLLLSEEDYFRIIESKTAELCSCSCLLGAYYAEAEPETVAALSDFGRWLGIAFQIVDDLLDLEGEEQFTGKSLGTDIQKRKLTLPLIHARDTLEGTERTELLTRLDCPDVGDRAWLISQLQATNSLEFAKNTAANFIDRASAALVELPPSPAKDALEAMALFVMARNA